MFVSSRELSLNLSGILEKLNVESLCLHTDLASIGPLDHMRSRSDLLEAYSRVILDPAEKRSILLPTFNYSYPRTRIYDVRQDPCEVGILNECFRRNPKNRRTRTPVFNFCLVDDDANFFNRNVLQDPFSEGSVFAQMVQRRTWMGFMGASLKSISFVHYVEHVVDVGYRYYKPFPGKVKDGDFSTAVDFGYKVRVLHPDFINENDWAKIDADMSDAGILHKYPFGNGQLLLLRCDHAFSFWYDALRKDDLYVFTGAARRAIEALGKKVGYPFKLEMFEDPEP